ncbi:unnamed protein product [Oncorhynchus mykiss]|uniref:Structural maintenance of chromosomes protein 6 n=1 Tax=Oncorhynchus mykiss TaxID=8022 RepID=A0A060WS77_ONCMY|nr:unnamed protein product [Oncorhynchus mykiss]
MKRKSKVLNDEKFTKKRRLEAVKEEEDGREDHGTSFNDHSTSPSGLGDIGVIESITIKNFMCHHLLGPFQFGPNVNFIVGNNGSGKSAILTALIVGLGGKATITNRGASLKGFVKNGESTADVTVKLRNRGPDAYKGDVYGECISIEQRISSDGVRTCRLKSKTGHLVSNKKDELTAILDHFNIQVDNPVSILNQEMSKQFLHSKSEADKYKFFMKATLLEQMKRDYIHIKQTKAVTREQVERQEECLKDLKQEFLQKKERYENLSSVGKMKETLEELKKMMAWCLVREKERLVQQLQEQIDAEESNHKHEENLQLCQLALQFIPKAFDGVEVRALCRPVKFFHTDLNKPFLYGPRIVQRGHCHAETGKGLPQTKVFPLLQSQMAARFTPLQLTLGIAHGDLRLVWAMETHFMKLSPNSSCADVSSRGSLELGSECFNQGQMIFNSYAVHTSALGGPKNIQVSMEAKLKRKNQLLASRSNKLKRFGDNMPDLLDNIDKAYIQGRFTKKPLGPIGACINLKDPALAVAVESCLRSFMKTFCCDNYKDEAVLQDLMSRYFSKGNRPQIIVSPFSGSVYKVQGRGVNHPDYPSVLDSLSIANPVIANCLIDMRGIESILIIKEKNAARRVMQQGRPPRNCREAFTVEGDQVYPNRYYTPDFSMAKYLGGDLETEIRQHGGVRAGELQGTALPVSASPELSQ